jgi:hypothetical protein
MLTLSFSAGRTDLEVHIGKIYSTVVAGPNPKLAKQIRSSKYRCVIPSGHRLEPQNVGFILLDPTLLFKRLKNLIVTL